MKRQIWVRLIGYSILIVGLGDRADAQIGGAGSQANDGTFITFDVPGTLSPPFVTNGANTIVINAQGTIAGTYIDKISLAYRGFVRTRDCPDGRTDRTCGGAITTFDVPGAALNASQGTIVKGINDLGAITGSYIDARGVSHGFIRSPDCYSPGCEGTFITFDAPGTLLSVGSFAGTFVAAIDEAGMTTGSFWDANYINHAFLRTADCSVWDHSRHCDAVISTFDFPGAGTGFYQGTFATSINSTGMMIIGGYRDASYNYSGFLRDAAGNFTPLSVPGSFPEVANTTPVSINSDGTIVGYYLQSSEFEGHSRGFMRTNDGAFVTFDATTDSACCISTYPTGINVHGTITGYYYDVNGPHGFLRALDGSIAIFDVPGAGPEGTFPTGINSAGTITGCYVDANFRVHGFVRK